MRKLLPFLFFVLSVSALVTCTNDTTQPPSSNGNGTVSGQIRDADFEYDVQPGEPGSGPFRLRGTHLHYDDELGALVVDLTVVNRGIVAQHEPIGLTFIKLDPDGVTLLDPDNDIHDDGAAITFHFANDDGLWTPGEASLPRTVQFGVAKGTAIAFVARIDIGGTQEGGTISGRVWNDANKDGVMDTDEGGIPFVGVYIYPFSDDVTGPMRAIRTVITGEDGHYAFPSLPAGGYVVSIAPSTVTLFPTTPTEIHVILVDVDGKVSDYDSANFGAVPNEVPPPPPQSEHIHATGKFSPPDAFASSSVESFVCADTIPQPLVTDPPVNDDCIGGRLRGSVTEIAPERHALRVMATWMIALDGIPADLEVGSRVDVKVHAGPGPLSWVLASLAPWTGDQDEITGRVDAIDHAPDGSVRLRVLDTWVTPGEVSVGPP